VNLRHKKIRLVVIFELVIASLFIIGTEWAGQDIDILFHSYFSDVFLPFGFYFLLTMSGDETKYLNSWWKKALVILALTFTSETLQYFGVYALARVFDPLDYLMYGVGVLFAVAVDRKIFTKIFLFWE
jgi:hypothetical protein